jgi:hypothetical protein
MLQMGATDAQEEDEVSRVLTRGQRFFYVQRCFFIQKFTL